MEGVPLMGNLHSERQACQGVLKAIPADHWLPGVVLEEVKDTLCVVEIFADLWLD